MRERTENGKYKQWDDCVERNYLPKPLACVQQEKRSSVLYRSRLATQRGGRGGEGGEKWDRERDWRGVEGFQAVKKEPARGREREAEGPQHLKVLNLWSLQVMQSKTCGRSPCHGLLQPETDLAPAERHSVTFLYAKPHTTRTLPTKRRARGAGLQHFLTKVSGLRPGKLRSYLRV